MLKTTRTFRNLRRRQYNTILTIITARSNETMHTPVLVSPKLDDAVMSLDMFAKYEGIELSDNDFQHLSNAKLGPFQGDISEELLDRLVEEDALELPSME